MCAEKNRGLIFSQSWTSSVSNNLSDDRMTEKGTYKHYPVVQYHKTNRMAIKHSAWLNLVIGPLSYP